MPPSRSPGTASDGGGGQVGGVEVSVDGGVTWHPANGRANWTYSWATGAARTVNVLSRAVDDSGNLEHPPPARRTAVGGVTSDVPVLALDAAQAPSGSASGQMRNAVELGTSSRRRQRLRHGDPVLQERAGCGSAHGKPWTATGTQARDRDVSRQRPHPVGSRRLCRRRSRSPPTPPTSSRTTPTPGTTTRDDGYFPDRGVDNGPLHAPQRRNDGVQRSYSATAPSAFPTRHFRQRELLGRRRVRDFRMRRHDAAGGRRRHARRRRRRSGSRQRSVSAMFNEAMTASTVNTSTVELRNCEQHAGRLTVTFDATQLTATLQPERRLWRIRPRTRLRVQGGIERRQGRRGQCAGRRLHVVVHDRRSRRRRRRPTGPGGPILVVSSAAIRSRSTTRRFCGPRASTHFSLSWTSAAVTATVLASYDVVILGEMPLTTTQVTMFSNWVTAGGNLIAMRPDKKLASLLGLTDAARDAGRRLPAREHRQRPLAPASSARRCSSTARRTIHAQRCDVRRDAVFERHRLRRRTRRSRCAASAPRRPGGGVHLRPRAIGRLHAPGQPGVVRPGARRPGADPIRRSVLRRRAGRLGRPDQGRDSAGRRAAAAAGEPDRLHERRPQAAAAFWYFPRGLKAAVVMTGDDHANGRHRRPVRHLQQRQPRRAAASPTGSAFAPRPTSSRTRRSPAQVADYGRRDSRSASTCG